jgi:hypothetical protein
MDRLDLGIGLEGIGGRRRTYYSPLKEASGQGTILNLRKLYLAVKEGLKASCQWIEMTPWGGPGYPRKAK